MTMTAARDNRADLQIQTVDEAVGVALDESEKVALRWAGSVLTGDALWQQAGRWAESLQAAGVRPGDLVGVCLPRTPDLIAALIGVHRAGAGYVPVDPAYPRERVELILTDSACAVTIADEQTRALVDGALDGVVITPAQAAEVAGDPAEVAPDATRLSHVIYTSGSTGRPKGVAIEHRQTMALLDWARQTYSEAELAGVLASTSVCFDLSVFEIFGTLAAGGTIVLADTALDLPTLPDRDAVTLVNTVPSAMGILTRGSGLPASVQTVNLAGEPLRRRLADAVHAQPGVRRLYNLYGPSEDTTYSTGALVPPDDDTEPAIGHPLPGTRAYLLDEHQAPVPAGEVGELYLAGAGVARGYLNRPELTAERFLADPWVPHERMYRTGDLCSLGADGALYYRGRADHQVKVRGFRVELGEVDAALLRHPSVANAVTVARTDPRTDALTLIAFVEGPGIGLAALRDFLAERLPHYMLPSLTVLPELPLTPNGKVDRARLPEGVPSSAMPAPDEAGTPPATDSEHRVAGVWAEVLDLPVEHLAADRSFADLGGNSLLAAAVIARLSALTGRRLGLPDLPMTATIQGVAARWERTAVEVEPAPVAGPAQVGRSYPAAPVQGEFWVSDTVNEGLAISVLPVLLRVEAALDLGRLQQALDLLVQRHDALRTHLHFGPHGAEAVVAEARPVPLRRAADRAELERLALTPLDLRTGPLLTAAVASEGDSSLLLLHLHHATADGWSLRLLVTDLAELYAGLATGATPPAPTHSFADSAAWLEQARRAAAEEHRAYWAQRLAGVELRSLPPTRTRPGPRQLRRPGGKLNRPLGMAHASLQSFCQQHGLTEHAVLLTLTAIRMQRELGTTDLVLRSPVSNRRRPEFEAVVGPFIETAVCRVQLDPRASFLQACQQVAQDSAADVEHAWAETALATTAAGLNRFTGSAPLGQVLVAVQTYAAADHTAGGLRWRYLEELGNGGAKTDLGFFWELNVSDGALLCVEYDEQLHDEAGVRRLGDQLIRLLEGAVADPHAPVSTLPWTTPEDLARIEAAQPATLLTASATTTAGVLAQAGRTPDAAAIHDPRWGTLTYAELVGGAAAVARRLDELDLPPTAPVAVACRRGAAGVMAMLGAWLTGRPYLPLDPSHPLARLSTVLEDAGAAVLVGDASTPGELGDGLPRLTVDERPTAHPSAVVDRSRLEGTAYLIYTSGSTGRPKGVRISHLALASFLAAMAEHLPLKTADTIAAVTTPSFDIAGLEQWLPLLHGASLGVATEEDTRDGDALARRLTEVGASVVQMTPSGWAVLLDGAGAALDLSQVRALVGAEPLPVPLATRLVASCAEVWNVYGPTEGTVWACLHRVRTDDLDGATVPVGVPLANTRCYVLDHAGQLAPPGVVGQVYLVGPSLADGYQRRDDLTAAAFAPLTALPEGPRSYRTGDLGRLDERGLLHCLGRADNQVKVRGVRIELEEVDGVLQRLPGVQAATSVVPGTGPAAGQLVGHLVLQPGTTVDVPGWQAAAGRLLPAAMVPTLWSVLERLPLTPSGKVDRAALPEPRLGAEPDKGELGELTELESFIAELWAEVLPQPSLGRGSSFFEVGGHSLTATRAVALVREELAVDISVRDLFEAPVLADFATRVEERLLAEEAAR